MAAIVVAPGAPGAALMTKVSLSFTLSNLPDLDIASKTDAAIQVYLQTGNAPEVRVGSTEKVKDNLNPKFATPIVLDYCFEVPQKLRLEIGDIDNHHVDMIGTFQCSIGDIMGARGQQLTANVRMSKMNYRQATVTIRGEEVRGQNATVTMQFSGTKLDKKDVGLFAKSDPYFNLYKMNSDNSRTLVYRSDWIKQTLDPVWLPFDLSLAQLCGGDPKRPLIFECFDWDKHSDHDYIGSFTTSLERLMSAEKTYQLINEKKLQKKGYTNSGVISLLSIRQVQDYTFLDYLAGGVQLNLALAVDYTGSNGDPANPSSLHYRGTGRNQYTDVIGSVGGILLPYDYDQWVPAYGFGGHVNGIGTSHCFAINGNPNKPEVLGVAGMLEAYNNSFNMLRLSGPTHMAPIINQVAQQAAALHAMGKDLQAYILLLIITDGEITDMSETMEAIVVASSLPLSIVIVGVGNESFDGMKRLDSDDKLLKAPSGRKAVRDIVQFVPFQHYVSDPMRLAAETLKELPGQVIQYMKHAGIVPRPRLIVQETVTTVTTTALPVVAPPM